MNASLCTVGRARVALLFALAIVLTSCNRSAAEPPISTAVPSGPEGPQLTKPAVEIPPGEPPVTMLSTDLKVGTGAEAVAGKTVRVHYVGQTFSKHQEFDASWNHGEPYDFPLGARRVIAGWDEGVAGMREGGRRRLIIPPGKAYGMNPPPGGVIGPNETLVFVIDLVKVL